MEADVVEELCRLHGYDRVPPMPVRRTEAVGHPTLTPSSASARRRGAASANRGLAEAVTWSFVEPELAERFGGGAPGLRNPINAELSVLRPSLLPNLLSAAVRNQNRDLPDVALFELGPRFFGLRPGEQEVTAGGIRVGASTSGIGPSRRARSTCSMPAPMPSPRSPPAASSRRAARGA